MEKEANSLKLFFLAEILWRKTNETHGLSARELIEDLKSYDVKIERKTLYKDLNLLQLYGFDIIKQNSGRNVLYYLGNRSFELPELKLIVDAIQSSKFITLKKSERLIKKLGSMTSVYDENELNRQVYVAGRVKSENESIYYTIDCLHTAINNDNKINFQYYELYGNKIKRLRHNGQYYNVSPWIMLWDNQNYYMIGYDENVEDNDKVRIYRLDRMKNVSINDKPRLGEAEFYDFDVGAFTKKTFGMFSGEEKKVSILSTNSSAGILFDRFGNDVICRTVDEGHVEIDVDVNVSDQFLGWILSLGNDIKITGPKEVVDRMNVLLHERIELYKY